MLILPILAICQPAETDPEKVRDPFPAEEALGKPTETLSPKSRLVRVSSQNHKTRRSRLAFKMKIARIRVDTATVALLFYDEFHSAYV